MVDAAPHLQTPEASPSRRDAMLEAVAFAAERLLLAHDWRDAAPGALERLGAALDVSRAWVLENHHDDRGGLRYTQVAEWCAPGVASQAEEPSNIATLWTDGYGRWAEAHAAGDPIVALTRDLPSPEREGLEREDIRAIAELPIFVADAWWGCLGFDDCLRDRAWHPSEIDAMRAVTGILGAALVRQRADEQRREAETRARQLVERIPAVTYTDVPDEGEQGGVRMGFVSPQIEQVLGYPPERFVDDPDFWMSLMHPDDLARLRASGALDPEDIAPFDQEYRMTTADGRSIWVHDTSTSVFRPDGTLDYFLGFMTDITARKEADARLRQAEEKFRLIVEHTPAITYQEPHEGWEYDPASVISYVSPQLEAILGYTSEEWAAPGFWLERMHPDDREPVLAEAVRTAAEGVPYRQDYRMYARDGRMFWFHDESVLLRDAEGNPMYWQGVMVDITERKEAEEQLRQAEERFRLIVERTPAVVYQELPSQLDPATSVTYVSPQIERILGYPATSWAEPGGWIEHLHPDDRERVLTEGERSADQGGPYTDEYRMIAADGRVVWFHDESVLIRDDAGEPVVWQGVMVDITEQKEAEHRLRSAEERYRALVEHIPAVVYAEAIVPNVDELYVSPQVEQVLGYTPEQWRAREGFWAEHLYPDDAPAVIAANDEANRTGSPFQREYRFLAADGRYRWLRDEAVQVRDDDGRALFWQGVLIDISGQKEAEEQLRETEERYRALVEHIPAAVYRQAPDADPFDFYISPQVEMLFGYTAAQWAEDDDFWETRIHPDDREEVLRDDLRTDDELAPFDREYRFRKADGSWCWVHDEAVFVPTDDGRGFWQGFILDITERKAAEEQLREAELKFRTIVEQSQAIFYTQEIDPDDPAVSKTTYIAPGNTDMLGYSLEEVLADPTLWRTITHPEDRERVFSADAETNRADADGSFSLEYRMIAKDGRIVWVQDEAVLVQLPGKPPYWQGFLLDITERKEAEEQLERALSVERDAGQRLRALDDMKNTFLQAVSHDLRTPLAAILGLAITLERRDVHLEEEDARDLARRIAGNARRLDRLVTNLLDMDRLARGIVAPKLEPIDVAELVRRILTESELVPADRLEADLVSIVVPVDAAKVERIVENLLVNTVRHTPASARIWVRVRPAADAGGVLIEVADDGPGVGPDLRETIFEPFRQGPDAPQHSPGVGVGLTLVRRFAELHGGRAWVQARAGGGASFRVLLPSDPPSDAVEEPGSP